ncbi:MAG: cyclase family protein [Chloroflexota bacterium]|nr:cyclase family protein [Chloroflexota bacterium]PLS76964.1 MAG: cyclase [Chloroflexota bacterium]
MPTFIDLSHRIEPGMPSYPGLPEPRLDTFMTHGDASRQGDYVPGTTFQIATYSFGGNTGTYVDAPFHRHPQGADLADLGLDKLADLMAVRVVALEEGPIGLEAFRGVELAGKAVLIRTDWADRWGKPDYFRSGPFLPADTCRFLVRAQVALVGIDCANIDNMRDGERPAHTILLAAGIPIVEHLRGLDELPPGGFRFFAVPPAIVGGTSFPVRAFAIVG